MLPSARTPLPTTIFNYKVRWPYQTVPEEAGHGLETSLAELVTASRGWLIARGFMTMDGPCTGGGRYDNGGVGWRKAVVARTHAAMCAAAMLRPGWGPGHRIMGIAEQVLCTLKRGYNVEREI